MAENTTATPKPVDDVEVADKKIVDGVEVSEIDVTLANGNEVTLDVILDREDWSYATLQAQAEGNTASLVNGVLTPASQAKLRFAGARVRDFRTVAEHVGEALEVLDDEDEQ